MMVKDTKITSNIVKLPESFIPGVIYQIWDQLFIKEAGETIKKWSKHGSITKKVGVSIKPTPFNGYAFVRFDLPIPSYAPG
jgi:hypothetical protein